MNQKGIFLLGADFRDLIEKAKLLSSSFIENSNLPLVVYGKNGATTHTFSRSFPFGIYDGKWLSISDWQGCRETFRTCIVNAFDALRPLGESRGLGLVCLQGYDVPNYGKLDLKVVVDFINNFFTDFSPMNRILSPGESLYNGFQDFHLLTKASLTTDPLHKTDILRITFPVTQNDFVTRYTTASMLVGFLRNPNLYLDKKGNPLRKDALIKSVADSLEKYYVVRGSGEEGIGHYPDSDPMLLLWLLLARGNFPIFSSISQVEIATLTGPSRLIRSILNDSVGRQELIYTISANGAILSDFFNNFNDNMDRIFRSRVRGDGIVEVYNRLREKFKKVIVEKVEIKPSSAESILSANKPTPRKRKVETKL